jgi:hypothetical protein
MTRLLAALALAAALAACGTPDPAAPATAAPAPVGASPPAVPWGDYVPGLQTVLDSSGCEALQDQFNGADANNDATMRRTGHNNAALMAYIDWLERKHGCRT